MTNTETLRRAMVSHVELLVARLADTFALSTLNTVHCLQDALDVIEQRMIGYSMLQSQDKYSLDTADVQERDVHPDNVPPTLMWYDGTANPSCPWCNGNLDRLGYFAHEGGWRVLGFARRQWLFKHCNPCNHDWKLSNLGVPTNVGDQQG